MKKTLTVVLAVAFVLAFAAPVFAQDMTHNAEYKMDGTIDLEKQVGHFCNTGAEMKQTIKGEGEMTKVMDTTQVAGKLTVSDQQDWVTAEDAVRNLTVTSVIELCAPAKSLFGEIDAEDLAVYLADLADSGLDADLIEFYQGLLAIVDAHEDKVIPVAALYEMLKGTERALLYDIIDMADYVDPLTEQIWAVQVEADAGFSGALSQGFEAAYGPWDSAHGYLGSDDEAFSFVDEDDEVVDTLAGMLAGNIDDVETGDDYVGNYFNIEQFARTSQGTVRRFIDISSPWSHALAYEDATIVGASEITDSFAMGNLAPGAEAVPDWWELF